MADASRVTAVLKEQLYTVELSDDLGHRWLSDEPEDLDGANEGPTPVRMLLASLGACTAITLKMYARRKEWSLEGVEVELYMEEDTGGDNHRTIIKRDIRVQGDLSTEQRERLVKIANACPVHRILTGEVQVHTSL